jgi:hypothetical protein
MPKEYRSVGIAILLSLVIVSTAAVLPTLLLEKSI